MSQELATLLVLTVLFLAGIIAHGETVRRIAKRERKDAYEKGYYAGYTDQALGRSRNFRRISRPTASADRAENQTETKDPAQAEA
jgi:hypothetical protein